MLDFSVFSSICFSGSVNFITHFVCLISFYPMHS
nr:MAG TPA: hypothetical protein [Caudoviricetes sp.]